MNASAIQYYLSTPTQQIALSEMPENRESAEARLYRLEALTPGEYCFWQMEDTPGHAELEQSVFRFQWSSDAFHLLQALSYDAGNVRVSDVKFYADTLKQCLDPRYLGTTILQGYYQADGRFDQEMMVIYQGKNTTDALAILFVEITSYQQLEARPPYIAHDDCCHCHVRTHSVHSALAFIEVFTEHLTGSRWVQLSTQHNDEFIG